MFPYARTILIILAISIARVNLGAAQLLGSPDNSQFYDGPYIQVYPPVDLSQDQQACFPQNSSTGTCPLFFAFVTALGGNYDGRGIIPGVQLAVDQINADPTLLPGYTLHFTLTDSQCERATGIRALIKQLLAPPIKVGIVGSGCSSATEPNAELSQYFNLTKVSCLSSSPVLSNRDRFFYYFQILASDGEVALGFFELIQKFQWRKVKLIVENQHIITSTMERLTDMLRKKNVTVTESRFETNKGIQSLEDPFDIQSGSDTRIFVMSMFEQFGRRLLCRAYQNNIQYPRYLFLTYAWYSSTWWIGSAEEQEALLKEYEGCTVEQRAKVAQFTLAVVISEFISNNSTVTDSGINGTMYYNLTELYRVVHPLNFSRVDPDYSQTCHDATWTLARGLDTVIKQIRSDETYGERLAKYNAELSISPEQFGLQHFTYNNSGVVDLVFDALEKTNFTGITGHIQFNQSTGVRRADLLAVFTHQIREGSLQRINFGEVDLTNKLDLKLTLFDGFTEDDLWGDEGIPYDGVPIEETVTVSIALTVIFSLLATAGIIFAIICLLFNIIFRNRKLVLRSSPKLNLLIVLGAIILYIDVYFFVIPTTNPTTVAVLCNITHWLSALGYSLCYGTIIAKMFRVYIIFNNPIPKTKLTVSNWMLALFVLLLVIIDLIILITYTAVEGVRGNLSAQRVPNRENSRDVSGIHDVITEYYIYVCDSRARDIALGILYGYKALLQVITLILAFFIRKVKVKVVNDSPYITFAIYVTSIVTAVIIVSTYSLKYFVNSYAVVFGLGFLVGTTVILLLVFVPIMVKLYRDPGEQNLGKVTIEDQPPTNIFSLDKQDDTVKLPAQPTDSEEKVKN